MSDVVNVKVVEDASVDRALNKFADKLNKKYNKKRKIDERLLRQKTPFERVMSAIVNTISAVLFVFCIIFCFSVVYGKVNNIPPSIGGYFCMRVSSPSMTKTGFYVGKDVIVRAVNTKTLNQGDIIAFYENPTHSITETNSLTKLAQTNTKKEYKVNGLQFFGVLSEDIKAEAKKGHRLIFHYIEEIYTDENGNRLFVTHGSSNPSADVYLVAENLVVGTYDDSNFANFVTVVLTTISSPLGVFIILLIPMLILIYSLVMRALKNLQLAMIENDVVEEKRKLTDPICVKNGIGYKMDKNTKYKVLAQAPDDKKLEYVNLLWKNGDRPEIVRKYYLRKSLIIKPNEQLLTLNRTCEQMFKDNVEPVKIAKYYKEERAKIEAEQKRYKDLVVKVGKLKKQTAEEEREEARIKVKLKATKNLPEMKKLAKKSLPSDKLNTTKSKPATDVKENKKSAPKNSKSAKTATKSTTTKTKSAKTKSTKSATNTKSKASVKTTKNSTKSANKKSKK